MTFSKILIAVEKTPLAFKVAQTGFSLAKSLQARVDLIHVVDPALTVGYPDVGILPSQGLELLKQEAHELNAQLIQMYGQNVNTFHFILEGRPAKEILLTAKNEQTDIIVMGTHGKSPLKQILLGSVAEEVLRHAPCPVLLVRETDI
ncbi:MAG: universal stress protein [Prochloraceae cyanobacterium]